MKVTIEALSLWDLISYEPLVRDLVESFGNPSRPYQLDIYSPHVHWILQRIFWVGRSGFPFRKAMLSLPLNMIFIQISFCIPY